MASKGVRKLRIVDAGPAPEATTEPVTVQPTPTLEQLKATNKGIEVQIAALGAQLVDYNNVVRNIAVEALIALLIEHEIIDQEEFEIRQQTAVNQKLSEALEHVKLEALKRQRAQMLQSSALEVVNGPGLLVPNGSNGKGSVTRIARK